MNQAPPPPHLVPPEAPIPSVKPSVSTRPTMGQWAIVRAQYNKNRPAVWGLRIMVGMVLVALYAPVLASGDPFLWRGPSLEALASAQVMAKDHTSGTQFPWFANLFNVNVYEHAIDRLFNLAMVSFTFWWVLWFVLRVVARLKERTHSWRRAVRPFWIGVTAFLCLLQVLPAGLVGDRDGDSAAPLAFLEGLVFKTSARRIVWLDEAKQLEAAADAYAAAPAQEGKPKIDADDLRPWGIRTPIPYGYREQLPALEDRHLHAFHFERGPHFLGTDTLGRDVMARVLYGTRIALTVGIVAVAIYVAIGTVLGSLAGYFRGKVDMFIMRLVEMMLCIPTFFLLLMVVALTPGEYRSIFLIMLVIGLLSWTGTTRLVRGEFLRERNREYVAAAQMLGLSQSRIIFRHILPNALSPVIVTATFGVAGAILTESGLAFLGLGDPAVPSWGGLLNEGRVERFWHLILPPSVAIFITVTALNLMGDGMRDALDPQLRN